MTLKYYHAEPAANSLKSMICLKEKGLDFESIYVNLHTFEQHSEWFVKINPEGQVPVLDHDGVMITHTTVINEYLEDAFPDAPPLRPADPAGKLMERIPLPDQRKKWMTARSGFSEADLQNATDKIVYACAKIEGHLADNAWLAGDMFTTADANFYSMCGMMVERMFPELEVAKNYPRLIDWRERMKARPGVQAGLQMPDHTNPALRTWTGEVR
jgi:glutathione S-transferase